VPACNVVFVITVAKNDEFFSQPILGRDIILNAAQRPGIYEVWVLKNVSPVIELVLKIDLIANRKHK